jgi:S-adenosylmethionine synthetase
MSTRTLTSESVTEGHPDKICDQISDAILDAMIEQDPSSRVAVETMVTTGLVHVAGEVTTDSYVEIPALIRDKLVEIGYTSSDIGFDGRSCGVSVSIGQQSAEIAAGVNRSIEARAGSTDPLDQTGAGDQGLMFGYASNETPELMPTPIMISHRLTRALSDVRRKRGDGLLRPDGKAQVTVSYQDARPVAVQSLVLSSQHHPDISQDDLAALLLAEVINPVLEQSGLDYGATQFHLNPSGRFETGGPQGDAGLTGRKIIVDTYGGASRHGGGAFSGKDPSKVDRSAAYAARWVAKNVVAAGLADRIELQVSYAIGRANPTSLQLETFGTEHVELEAILRAINQVFDLRPAAIIRDLDLLRPIYAATASYGHFGRPGFSWEATDRAQALRDAAGR